MTTPSLVLRAWSPDDADALTVAIEANLDHLRPWMPWIREEPLTMERRIAWLQGCQHNFARGSEYAWGMFAADDETRVVGAVGLHRRIGAGAGEIGYWVHLDHTGHGYASEAAAAVTRVGVQELGMRRIEIQCDPDNVASAAIARKLGFTHQVTIPGRVIDAKADQRDTMIWTLLAKDSPAV